MQYEELAAQQTNATAMSNVKWLIVDTCCGLGNLLLMNIRGLMMALRMRRAITFLEENDLTYDMASVLPIMPVTVPAALGWPHTSTKVFATDHRDGHRRDIAHVRRLGRAALLPLPAISGAI